TVTIPASAPLAQLVFGEAAQIGHTAPTPRPQAPGFAAGPFTEDISTPAPAERGAKEPMRGLPISAGRWGWIAGIYLLVGGILLLRMLIGIVAGFRLIRTARPLEEAWTAGSDVRISSAVSAPVTFGSTILLPSDCINWDAAKRRAVLAHEQSHRDH